ncbi:hypothetical protein CHS0354_015390 [Potamilus streckersoni]|uniref:Uncharacterized protein n=1 Tax=Potamilus streckersoni TaxID=2493646 RepID=A0AAE0S0P2_9BIVA|nr:hypothetical protein CHS0354_015390 [Potamilus streckersoni]
MKKEGNEGEEEDLVESKRMDLIDNRPITSTSKNSTVSSMPSPKELEESGPIDLIGIKHLASTPTTPKITKRNQNRKIRISPLSSSNEKTTKENSFFISKRERERKKEGGDRGRRFSDNRRKTLGNGL